MKRYNNYSEIPAIIQEYVLTVAGVSAITKLSLNEINNFLFDMEHYYDGISNHISQPQQRRIS